MVILSRHRVLHPAAGRHLSRAATSFSATHAGMIVCPPEFSCAPITGPCWSRRSPALGCVCEFVSRKLLPLFRLRILSLRATLCLGSGQQRYARTEAPYLFQERESSYGWSAIRCASTSLTRQVTSSFANRSARVRGRDGLRT